MIFHDGSVPNEHEIPSAGTDATNAFFIPSLTIWTGMLAVTMIP